MLINRKLRNLWENFELELELYRRHWENW